jgi:diguanylate cyclase (GGDEF)-like protein
MRRKPTRFELYLAAVTIIGLPLAGWTVADLPEVAWHYDAKVVAFLVAATVIGELLPIEIARYRRASAEITISSAFSLALMFMAPLGCVVLAQAIPLLIDDIRRGKHWSRPVFNVAQYTVAFAASRLVFCLISRQDFLRPEAFSAAALPAAFAAAAAFFAVNHCLVSAAMALWSGEPVLGQLSEDLRFQLITSGLLVSLAPVVLGVMDFSFVLVPVLLLPIAAVRDSARLAVQRNRDALHDALTGLANRALLKLELNRTLAEMEREDDGLALIFIDLDHFKEVNDTLGHHIGDSLIIEVAARLVEAMPDAVMVARLGGDEFAVLARLEGADGAGHLTQATKLAHRLSASFDPAVSLAGVRLEVRASIGLALAPLHAGASDELLTKADIAMYMAKNSGGSGWAIYDARQDVNTPERLMLLTEMRDGLEREEFVVYYQPKCDVHVGSVTGAEALVRWQHPTRGLLAPNEFIPLAETTELITQLTLVVLEKSVRQARSWLDAGRWLGVAVNLSVRHLTDLNLPDQVRALLTRYKLPAGLLTLEVTESTVMNDPVRAATVLSRLRGFGVKIAVDDYGTGYSSLAYLKRLAVDELKIDRSFISGMTTDENDLIIVRSTIDLGHNLGLQVVAEGVEDLDTWRALQTLGCDTIQGYIVSRPQPAADFTAWLGRWEQRVADRSIGEPGPTKAPIPARASAVTLAQTWPG